MSLFVLSSKDGWVNIMYDGLDAVAVDVQVCIRQIAKTQSQAVVFTAFFVPRIPQVPQSQKEAGGF